MKKITVVGGGFSGMTIAHELAKRGFQVDLYEKSSRLGGLIHTQRTHHGIVETAANGLIWTRALEQLCNEIDLKLVKALQSSRKRYFFRGKPTTWPLNIFESILFFPRLIFSLLSGKLLSTIPSEQSVFDWSRHRLGLAATNNILAPGLQGIYAGDIQKLSASLILSPLLQRKKTRYRGSVSGAHGMQDVIDALENKLKSQGVRIFLNSSFHWNNSQPIVLATAVKSAAEMLAPHHATLAQLLEQIEVAPLISVTAFWKKNNTYPGFGCLIPRSQGLRTLGVLMNTCIFPNRGQNNSETYILGGATDSKVMQLSDSEIHSLILSEREKIFKCKSDILSLHITRWPQALPHYTVQLEKLLPQLQPPKNVYLHGNYLGSLGLSKILDRSIALAESIEKIHG